MEIIAPKSTTGGSGEMEIDVANLPATTIRKLQRFVKDLNSSNNPQAANLAEKPAKGNDAMAYDSDEDDDNDPDYT